MKIFACLALVVTLSVPAGARDEREALAQAATKAADLDSYAWKGETEFQTAFGGGPAQIPTVDGTFQKGIGLYLKSDRGDFFRKDDRSFVKPADGEWQDLKSFRPAPRGGGNNPNRARGTAYGLMMLRNFKAPHEELRDLVKGLKEIKKGEKPEKINDRDCLQYSGDLSEEAMKASPLGRMLGQFGGTNAAVTGSTRIWVDDAGNIVIYEILTKASVELQGNTIDLTLTRRSEISERGKAKVDVPEGVQKLLESKPKAEEPKPDDKKGDEK
jgi:hypothetical protein